MRISKTSASARAGDAATVAFALFATAFIASEPLQRTLLGWLFRDQTQFVHSRVSLASMTAIHLVLALSATFLSGFVGLSLGILITRRAGRAFYPIVARLNAFIQTFPPSAVVILAFPFLGFGWEPTLLALVLYSLFPVLGNCAVALRGVDPAILDAADGMGMTEAQRLFMVELPRALPLIVSGIRHAYILNLGTATIGAVIGAGGLGTIIISGLTLRNSALVLSGTLVIVALALAGDRVLTRTEAWLRGGADRG